MRLFLGFDLPNDVKNKVYDHLRPIHQTEKGWEKAHDYHQTLLFIGEATEDHLTVIKNRMDSFSFHPFNVTARGFKFFSRRVMYLSFEQSEELLKFKDRVEQTFSEWIQPHSKPFIPHVTVKRWQRYEYDHIVAGLNKNPFNQIEFSVNGLDLFESRKDAENNKYHVIYHKSF